MRCAASDGEALGLDGEREEWIGEGSTRIRDYWDGKYLSVPSHEELRSRGIRGAPDTPDVAAAAAATATALSSASGRGQSLVHAAGDSTAAAASAASVDLLGLGGLAPATHAPAPTDLLSLNWCSNK
eukprot:SAG25_NODE_1135_length_3824_cov_5.545756_3_plen_127_part_00